MEIFLYDAKARGTYLCIKLFGCEISINRLILLELWTSLPNPRNSNTSLILKVKCMNAVLEHKQHLEVG